MLLVSLSAASWLVYDNAKTRACRAELRIDFQGTFTVCGTPCGEDVLLRDALRQCSMQPDISMRNDL